MQIRQYGRRPVFVKGGGGDAKPIGHGQVGTLAVAQVGTFATDEMGVLHVYLVKRENHGGGGGGDDESDEEEAGEPTPSFQAPPFFERDPMLDQLYADAQREQQQQQDSAQDLIDNVGGVPSNRTIDPS